ncbi:MAG: hypothetical protein AMJ90_05330 [candidate division Zixibacteria bacterium SM23_73_2]|nr:MAG: hypothetical protein AMJ90_05330 [candidate division Zixibacteria bacterium SM23_73_2]
MKKVIFVVLTVILFSLLVSNLAFSQLAEVKVGKGTLKIGGILQAGFTYNLEDSMGFDSFTLNRARILLWGDIVPNKIKYFVQTETYNVSKGEVIPVILDYKAQFFYIQKTEITVGRFLPNFTLYMPYHTGKLEMINYPLTTQRYAVWRQVGIQTTTQTDYVDFNLGIFNGYPANNFSDNNDAFDFFGRVDFKPPVDEAKIRFGGYAWLGNADPGGNLTDSGTVKWNRFGGFAMADYKASEKVTLRFRGEFLVASTEYVDPYYCTMDSLCTTDGQAFFAQIGVQPDPRVEFLARYDHHDPDKDMSYEEYQGTAKLYRGSFDNGFGMMNDDEEAWLTIGVNYYLEGINSMFYLNYIHKMEPGDKNVQDETGKWIKEEREIDNDLIVAQVQITF